ncbi:hypothetical protein [Ralstonia phage Reminis]|uniref:Uncharacterized protein n=1 Tax=Ralstonia phage Reminis TaxID=2662139 RepID=A0A5Q2U9J1_9CAUD|nr:hypothetical protein [Ralstonia phage Reminis]
MSDWSDNQILGAAAGWLLAVAPLAAFMLFMKVVYILSNLM